MRHYLVNFQISPLDQMSPLMWIEMMLILSQASGTSGM